MQADITPAKGRLDIYQQYAHLRRNKKDRRSMDEICQDSSVHMPTFEIQAQQAFLQEYVATEKKWNKLLLYHEIGSGKTCTSILIALAFLRQNPQKHRVWVILPARLKENYLDELMSPCSGEKYISQKDRARYSSPDVSESQKKSIRRNFKRKVDEDFTIVSFQSFVKNAKDASMPLPEYFKKNTKNTLVIVDEVHNLLSSMKAPIQEDKQPAEALVTEKLMSAMSTTFLQLSQNMHTTARLVGMTATPVFDNIAQFRILVSAFSKEKIPIENNMKIGELLEKLRGVVSFFPGSSKNAYPEVKEKMLHVPMTEWQVRVMGDANYPDEDEDMGTGKDSFLAKQRQTALVALDTKKDAKLRQLKRQANKEKLYEYVYANLGKFAPKLTKCIDLLGSTAGKHVVYSSFIANGIDHLDYSMQRSGWTNLVTFIKERDLLGDEKALRKLLLKKKYRHRAFFVWDSRLPQEMKHVLLKLFNGKDNTDGRFCRVVLGSPSIREGVSFKHVQYMHILDPVWNENGMRQLKGRVIRFCSHADIDPRTEDDLTRRVNILYYMLKVPSHKEEEWKDVFNVDKHMYETIIPQKYEEVQKIESVLRKIAIDHYLFRNLYMDTKGLPKVPQKGIPEGYDSHISLPAFREKKVRQGQKKKGQTCPKQRRPSSLDGSCPPDMESRINKHGDACCYKVSRAKKNRNK